jgi:hypothetical protein
VYFHNVKIMATTANSFEIAAKLRSDGKRYRQLIDLAESDRYGRTGQSSVSDENQRLRSLKILLEPYKFCTTHSANYGSDIILYF